MDRHQETYIERIQRAQDFIEAHLDEKLSLEDVAKVACFSPYHFHRLFKGVTGETLSKFIARLRLEKAAHRLRFNPKDTITEIALDLGYSDGAVFARAFKAQFGVSATGWRNGEGCPQLEDDRKNRKVVRNLGQAGAADDSYGEGVGAMADGKDPFFMNMTQPTKAAQNVRVEEVPAFHMAYVRHVGPYAGDSQLFGRLFGRMMQWAGPRGLVQFPKTQMLTVYHDDPSITEDEKLRISVGLTVPEGTKGEGEIGVMPVSGGTSALAHFELSAEEYPAAWQWCFGTWLPSSGYQPDDRPAYELYLNNPEEHPEKKHIVEIVLPIRPL